MRKSIKLIGTYLRADREARRSGYIRRKKRHPCVSGKLEIQRDDRIQLRIPPEQGHENKNTTRAHG